MVEIPIWCDTVGSKARNKGTRGCLWELWGFLEEVTRDLILKDKYILLQERYGENAIKTHPVISSGWWHQGSYSEGDLKAWKLPSQKKEMDIVNRGIHTPQCPDYWGMWSSPMWVEHMGWAGACEATDKAEPSYASSPKIKVD